MYNHLQVKELVPTLVEGIAELLKAEAKEKERDALHRKLMKRDPSVRPRRAFNSLHWLASYLMRHNPNQQQAQNSEAAAENVAMKTYAAEVSGLLPQ